MATRSESWLLPATLLLVTVDGAVMVVGAFVCVSSEAGPVLPGRIMLVGATEIRPTGRKGIGRSLGGWKGFGRRVGNRKDFGRRLRGRRDLGNSLRCLGITCGRKDQ